MEKLVQIMEELTNKIKTTGAQRFTISCSIEFDDAKPNIATSPKPTLKAASSL